MFMYYYVDCFGKGVAFPAYWGGDDFIHSNEPYEASQCCWRIPNAPGDWSSDD